jgi:hypothetical protein
MRQLLESDLTRVYSQWGDASSPLLPFPTDTFHTNCSFCNSKRVLSARAYLERPVPSVILIGKGNLWETLSNIALN